MAVAAARGFGIVMVAIAVLHLGCHASVYKVGDAAGWTTIGTVDYKLWAATKTFQVGDIILFEYNSQFHNVMRVTHGDYKSCNVTKPIKAFSTGNDTITITNHGHHFFLCGVPGHCQAGQKVDINVLRANLMAVSPSSSPSAVVQGPSPTEANRALNLNVGYLSLIVIVTLVSSTIMVF